MPGAALVTAKLENLLINPHNPRYEPTNNQREALVTIAVDQGLKMYNLAEDIVVNGVNPSDLPIVTPSTAPGDYVVLEGNRRVTALKLLSSAALLTSLGLPDRLLKKYIALIDRAKGTTPTELICVSLSREDATNWIMLKHTGENKGVGIVSWDGRATYRFRGSSPALQAVDCVEKSKLIDEATRAQLPKIPISNIERVLNTPDARKLLGIEVKQQKLSLKTPVAVGLARLALLVTDIANRKVRVTDLDSRQQRIEYARQIASRPLPKPISSVVSPSAMETEAPPVRQISAHRLSLIPKGFKLRIQKTRINHIFDELKKLNTETFLNSSAVLLRVFVELSVDDFAKRHNISLRVAMKAKQGGKSPQGLVELSLRKKLVTVTDYMQGKGICTKDELHGVRALISNHSHILSIDTLNAYVHNPDYNPIASELRLNWDNIQVFIERLWAK